MIDLVEKFPRNNFQLSQMKDIRVALWVINSAAN